MSFKKEFGFKRLTQVDEALEKYLKLFKSIDESETVETVNSLNRVLTKDIKSPEDIPPFNRSAMDGYAVRSIDVSGASESSPVRLKLVGYSTTSNPFNGSMGQCEAVRIDTGARMPEGADSVVMLEYTRRVGDYIEVFKQVSPYENVSLRGEDVRKGDVIVYGGILLTPYDIACLINAGIYEVEVFRKVKVGLAAVGSELLDFPSKLPEGMVREVNRINIKYYLSMYYPVEFKDYGIIPDDHDRVREVIEKGIEENDVMITIGGSSLGKGDVVTDIAENLGNIIVHGVALYPSRPVLLSEMSGKPYIGVPGYPVAAAVTARVFLEPVIMKLAGIRGVLVEGRVKGRLSRRVSSRIGFRHYVRVKLKPSKDGFVVEPIYTSGAGILSSLSLGDGYLIIPEDVEGYEAGDEVEVILYRRVIKV